jgi:hypothetical protein
VVAPVVRGKEGQEKGAVKKSEELREKTKDLLRQTELCVLLVIKQITIYKVTAIFALVSGVYGKTRRTPKRKLGLFIKVLDPSIQMTSMLIQ